MFGYSVDATPANSKYPLKIGYFGSRPAGSIFLSREDNIARTYHVEIAAVVAQADTKWVDNLLSHFDVPGVAGARQGVARRLSTSAIQIIALTRFLSDEGHLPLADALSRSAKLLGANDDGARLASFVRLAFDRDEFMLEIDRRIADAVESVVPRRRGRPPRRIGPP